MTMEINSPVRSNQRRPRRQTRPFPPADVVSEAWQLFVDNFGFSIASFVVLVLMVGLIAALPSGLVHLAETMADQDNGAGSIVAQIFSFVLSLTAIFVITDLLSGYYVLQIKLARQQPVEWSDLFCGGRFVTRLLFTSILFTLIVAFGLVAFIIPGILMAIAFFPFAHVLVDEDLPWIECFRRAKRLTDGNWPSIIIVFFVSLIALIFGATACIVGLIAAIPFVNLLFAVTYDWMTCQVSFKSLQQEADSRAEHLTLLRAAVGRTPH